MRLRRRWTRRLRAGPGEVVAQGVHAVLAHAGDKAIVKYNSPAFWQRSDLKLPTCPDVFHRFSRASHRGWLVGG